MKRLVSLAVAMLLIAGCSRSEPDAGAIGADEQQQLNDAAAMLDANSVSANLILDNQTGNPR